MRDPARAAVVLRALRAAGAALALVDFGSTREVFRNL